MRYEKGKNKRKFFVIPSLENNKQATTFVFSKKTEKFIIEWNFFIASDSIDVVSSHPVTCPLNNFLVLLLFSRVLCAPSAIHNI